MVIFVYVIVSYIIDEQNLYYTLKKIDELHTMKPMNPMRITEEKKKRKTLFQDEKALSEVIGALLIMGIILSSFSLYVARQVPELTKEYESLHMCAVTEDFGELDSLIDGIVLVAKQQTDEVATGTKSVKMSPDKVPILGMSPPGSILSFQPQTEEIFMILPYVGTPPTGPVYNFTWVESTTTDFSNPNATRVNVDVTFDKIKLARLGISGDLILDNDIITLGGEYSYDTVEITNNSIIYLVPGYYLKIHANSIFIDATSAIIADGRGYLGGTGGRIGNGPGFGSYEGPAYNGSGGGGAGYGGDGGDGGCGGAASPDDVGAGGVNYSDNTSSAFDFGSGGGGGGYGEAFHANPYDGEAGGDGGNGGGAVLLNAPQITIAGSISADGGYGTAGAASKVKGGGGGGGGSGGCITIQGYEVNISSATFSAQGGPGGNGGDGDNPGVGGGGGGGGSGGRMKIFYENVSLYDNTSLSCSVDGGTRGEQGARNTNPSGVDGTAGTFYENETTYISSVPHYTAGYYVSRVHDTGNTTTCYGNMTWAAYTDEYTSLVMKVRTSRSPVMDGNASLWANCPAIANGQDISELSSVFDGHRYIQYRAEFLTYDTSTTPVLDWVRINYSSSNPEGGSTPVVDSAAGILKFQSSYLYYPNQELVYAHGAVIQSQDAGEEGVGFMRHEPPINITNASGIPNLVVSLVDLTGSNYTYAGSLTMSVENTCSDYDSSAGTISFDNLSINITTEYPSVWGKWFNDTLEESELDESYYNVSVNTAANRVLIEFYGHGSGVQLFEEKTTLAVEIKQ